MVEGHAAPAVGTEVPTASPLRIALVGGTGEGATKLAAFDAALSSAGVENFNLIRLSSIIPPSAQVLSGDGALGTPPGEWGDRLYVVIADACQDTLSESAVAGIGWAQRADSGAGLFVEHAGTSVRAVEREIEQSLGDLCGRRGGPWRSPERLVRAITCEGPPAAAVALAVFGSEDWSSVKRITENPFV